MCQFHSVDAGMGAEIERVPLIHGASYIARNAASTEL